jgi:hypothetical protein
VFVLSPTALASRAHVGPLVPVSQTDPLSPDCTGPNRDAEIEPTLAVKPRNPDEQVMAWMQGPTSQALTIVSANSSDGGKSWDQVLVPDNTLCTGGELELVLGPWLSYGPKRTVYLSSIAFSGADPDLGVTINRSADNGESWSDPLLVGGPSLKATEAITADPVRAGTGYAVWRESANPRDIRFARFEDGGSNWSEPISLYEASPLEIGQMSEILAIGPGKLVAVFTVTEVVPGLPTRLLARRSSDGGRTWSGLNELAEVPFIQPHDPETGAPVKYGPHFFAADGVPGHGVFVAYQDPTSPTESRIMVTSSKDGRHWSAPRLASEGAVSPFTPDLAVDPNGTLALRFYDFRNDVAGDGELTTDSWFRHSHDGGRSWKEAKLGSGFDLRTAPLAGAPLPGFNLGVHQGLAPTHKGFATAFARAKPAALEGATDVFYTRVKVSPVAPRTKITKGVPRTTRSRKVTIRFRSNESDSTFVCRLATKRFKPCTSPKTFRKLGRGKHVIQVKAIDAAGNVDPTPAKDKFKVVR